MPEQQTLELDARLRPVSQGDRLEPLGSAAQSQSDDPEEDISGFMQRSTATLRVSTFSTACERGLPFLKVLTLTRRALTDHWQQTGRDVGMLFMTISVYVNIQSGTLWSWDGIFCTSMSFSGLNSQLTCCPLGCGPPTSWIFLSGIRFGGEVCHRFSSASHDPS